MGSVGREGGKKDRGTWEHRDNSKLKTQNLKLQDLRKLRVIKLDIAFGAHCAPYKLKTQNSKLKTLSNAQCPMPHAHTQFQLTKKLDGPSPNQIALAVEVQAIGGQVQAQSAPGVAEEGI